MPSSFSDMPGAVRDKKVALRVVEFFCAIIGLACTAGAVTNIFRMGYHSFHVFVFVMAFIFDAVFLIVYARGHTLPSNIQGMVRRAAPRRPLLSVALNGQMPKIEVAISALWSLFFFAASIAYAVNLNELKVSQPDWNFKCACGKHTLLSALILTTYLLRAALPMPVPPLASSRGFSGASRPFSPSSASAARPRAAAWPTTTSRRGCVQLSRHSSPSCLWRMCGTFSHRPSPISLLC